MGCEWIRIAGPLFLWHDQPREERALRDGRAMDAQELTPRERWSRSTTRVNAAEAAESRYDSCAQVTGARASSIVGMLGPVLLVDVPAALWNAGPKGFDARVGTSAGNQPENWWAE